MGSVNNMGRRNKSIKFYKNKSTLKKVTPANGSGLELISAQHCLPQDERQNNRFILEQRLGEGGMCEVFAALDLRRADFDDPLPKVALKKLLPEFKNNSQAQLALAQEFAKTRVFNHPGIIKVYDLHQYCGEVCFSMELLKGLTMKQYIDQRKSIKIEDEIKIVAEIASALSHIHHHGLIHADLKPGNIFINNGQTIIFDFNISMAVPVPGQSASSPIQSLINSQRLPAHTKAYAAIERQHGEPPSQSDDVFALAVTAYELFTGVHPYNRWSAIKAEIKKIAPAKPANLDRRKWAILKAGFSFKSEKRPSAAEIHEAFSSRGFINKFFV